MEAAYELTMLVLCHWSAAQRIPFEWVLLRGGGEGSGTGG